MKLILPKSNKLLLMLSILLMATNIILPQSNYSIIKGRITDTKGTPLPNANISLTGSGFGIASSDNGYYLLKIKPGNYTLQVTYVGYNKALKKFRILNADTLVFDFRLTQNTFNIGGIEVIGETDLLPNDVNTKTVINAGEIEHYQASSVKDVLDLVPGVQKSDNPGLNKTTQAAVRGDDSDLLSAFGTSVIIDGTPVSNNANLQFEKLTGSKFGSSNLGGGVDLRTIPADNIESIEILTGLPSARYGDFTSGIIKIKTKKGNIPNRLKLKNNPDTREANLGGGFLISKSALSYNFNIAQSERDVRKTGDEYTRFTGQTIMSNYLFDNRLEMNNKINFQFIFDEEEPKGDLQRIKNYNRGFTLGYSNWGDLMLTENISSLKYNSFVTMRRENSMRSRLVQSDLRILPNQDTVSIYTGKVETKGIEWTLGARLEYNKLFYTGSFIHNFSVGTNPQYTANTGEGLILDSLFNYYGSESGRRSYSFNDIPGQLLTNFYIEDNISGHFLLDFKLNLGLRYDLYQPEKLNFSGLFGDGNFIESAQGSFLNPRFNLMLVLSKDSQVRLSAGSTSKSPPLGRLYPPETVFTWRNPVDSTINYFRYNRSVPKLKGYKEWQYEVSYDHKLFNKIGTTISAYYKSRNDEPESETVPVFHSQSTGDKNYVYYIDSYSLYRNAGFTESKGIEFTVSTKKIEPLNMEFKLVGSYNYLRYASRIRYYDSTPDASIGQYDNYLVPGVGADTLVGMVYSSGESWKDRFQLNYYMKYTSKELGLWITLRAEQLVIENYQNNDKQPRNLSLLNDSQMAEYLFSTAIKTKPNKWLLSLSISKSLFKGAEVSFYVNNFLDDPALRRYNTSTTTVTEEERNPPLYYGLEFSMIIDSFYGGNNE